MRKSNWTPAQREAIHTVDRSALVSAAAGSGKTAVLAERCAYLVCEAPAPFRCDVDQLLVLTFTDAAAAEMRSRIAQSILDRAADQPRNTRLQIQARTVGAARISTLHSFCLWMTRRWFDELGVDPAATVLDEHEAAILRARALDEVMEERYSTGEPLRQSFVDLVEHYGLGDDERIKPFLLSLDAFLRSLPEPAVWTNRVVGDYGPHRQDVLERFTALLNEELKRQQEFCRSILGRMRQPGPLATFYVARIEDYLNRLKEGSEVLSRRHPGAFDQVQKQIAAWNPSATGAPRKNKDTTSEELAERDFARSLLEQVRDRAYEKRLLRRYGRFSAVEWLAGLERTEPHVKALIDGVEALQRRYQQKKRALAVLDYADLERMGYQLLRVVPAARQIRGELQQRFAQVLVDEFQDINPLQAAIIEAVCRENRPSGPANLFVVGDVKQSIYRFRLAEPGLFLRRIEQLESDESGGALVRLDANFRSAPAIIAGVNAVFEKLMRAQAGGIEYAQGHLLTVGRQDQPEGTTPIEVHLLERTQRGIIREEEDRPSDDEARFVDADDPAEWEAIEREAYVIGQEIRKRVDGSGESGRKASYGDIAILLRAATHTARPISKVLQRMGIPTQMDAADGLLESLEVRDVLALLHVLDNSRQDIPLAAVMRSGVGGLRFSESELLRIRHHHREGDFHHAVERYLHTGAEDPLRRKLDDFRARLRRFRNDFRRRPLADALGRILGETGYAASVAGLPGGPQRRANLNRLQDYARTFGGFHRQGLHRFLRFIEGMEHERRDWSTANVDSAPGPAVRIMSIHRSKGLEFPVVFVADLGRRFNLSDVSGSMIFDRDAGIGLKVVDRQRMIEYPSLLHHLAAERSLDQSVAEELRVLYVAMTRARDRLILVGTAEGGAPGRLRALWSSTPEIDPLTLLSARCPLDWLVPALACLSPDQVEWGDSRAPDSPIFSVRAHHRDDISQWRLDSGDEASGETSLAPTVATLSPLPAEEPRSVNGPEATEIMERLEFVYPRLAVTSVRAVMGVSEAKRQFEFVDEAEARGNLVSPLPDRRFSGFRDALHPGPRSATGVGRATHALLQHLDFAATGSPAAIAEQWRRLAAAGLINEGKPAAERPPLDLSSLEQGEGSGPGGAAHIEKSSIDLDSIFWFAQTPLGRRIAGASDRYHREYLFVMTVPVSRFDPQLAQLDDEEVLVRGIVDGLLVHDDHVELIDFKTDRISEEAVSARTREYRLQMEWYAEALERIWKRPVPAEKRHLVFLHPRIIVPSMPIGSDPEPRAVTGDGNR